MKTADRNGLTLLEVVVTVAIILVMLSLILPAVRNVRGPGYRTQCLNNQRNVAVSLHWYASTNNGDLPPRASYLVRSATDAGYLDVVEGHSWAVDVLPYLDQQGTYDR